MTNEIMGIAGGRAPVPGSPSRFAAILRVLAGTLLMLTFASSAAWAQGLPIKTCSNGRTAYLCQGDILVADPNAGVNVLTNEHDLGRIILIDPVSGQQTIVAQGPPFLSETVGVIFDPNDGNILVADRDTGVIRVNPANGVQTQLSHGNLFHDPFGIALDDDGNIFVADSGWRATLANDNTIVPSVNFPGQVILVNRTTGAQTPYASGAPLVHPYGIAFDPINSTLYVSDMSSYGGKGAIFSVPSPQHLDLIWGPDTESPVANQLAPMGCPLGLAVDASGSSPSILASVFAYPAGPPQNVYGCVPPGIFRVALGNGGPGDGVQTTVSGNIGWHLPFGLVVEPSPDPLVPPNILVADEGLQGIYRLNSLGNFVFLPGCPPGPMSPACGSPNFLVNPVSVTVRHADPSVNIADPSTPIVSINGAPASSPEGTAINLTSTVIGTGTLTYAWSATKNGGAFASGTGTGFSFTPDDNGTYQVQLTVATSASPATGSASVTIIATNLGPTASINGAPATSPEGTPISVSGAASDPSTADMAAGPTLLWTVLKNGSPFATGPNFTPNDNGTYAVTLTVTDKDGAPGSVTTNITVTNVAPGVSINGAPATSPEGTLISLTGTAIDPSTADTAAGLGYSWTVLKNGSPFATSPNFTPNDNGTYAVTLTVTDKDGGMGLASTSITVTNIAPNVSGVPALVAFGTAATITVNFTANFTDAGTGDTHACTLSWNDGTPVAGVVTETNGSGSCVGSRVFTGVGTYSVTATVNDGIDSASDTEFLVIYDPTAGYVSGSGFINSPAGAYPAVSSLAGKANFAFNTRYKLGLPVPSGPTTFNFNVSPANLKFAGVVYEWLVVTAPVAQFKGSGTINGTGNYGFIVTAVDGHQTGGSGVDRFRIKIWNINPDSSRGATVYDNVMGAPEDLENSSPQSIGGGNVLVFLDKAPTEVIASIDPTSVRENEQYSRIDGSFTDTDLGDPHTVTVDWGDGSAVTTIAVPSDHYTFTADHAYVQNNASAYSVAVTVGDSYGKSGNGATPATVTNVAPSIISGTWPTSPVNAGSPATVKANFTDLGILDTHTCDFSWGDSTTSAGVVTETNGVPPASLMSGSCTASHNYATAGTYTVYVTTFDDDHAAGVSGAITINVNAAPGANNAPVVTTLNITNPVKENVNATLSGSFTDQSSTGNHTVTYVWGDGTANTVQNLSPSAVNFSATHKYANEIVAVTATVTVTDSGSLSDNKSVTFAVINGAPVLSNTIPASTKVLPGATVTISPAFTDGLLDGHTCDYVWDTGGAIETVTANPAIGNGSCTKAHTFPSAGVYNGSVTVKDDVGANVKVTFKVIVDTKPTNLSLTVAAGPVVENDTPAPTVSGSFTDPDSTHKVTIAWGDGTSNTVISALAAGVTTFSANHKYKDNNPGYAITVTLVDNNSLDSISSSTSLAVNNAAPVITSTGPAAGLPLWINFTDAGSLDSHTCNVTWGDTQSSEVDVNESGGNGYCQGTHSYAAPGTYTIGVTVTDKDGASATRTYSLVQP